MRIVVGLLIFLMLTHVMDVSAQDGYPLPDDLQPITAENASQIQEFASIGSELPRQLLWSPDGTVLAVGTSDAVYLYDANSFESPPRVISDSGNIYFNYSGELVINNQRWDVHTLEVSHAGGSNNDDESNSIQVLYQDQEEIANISRLGDAKIKVVVKTNNELEQLILSPDGERAAIIVRQDTGLMIVQLWNITSSHLITEIPLYLELIHTFTFHADGKLLIIAATTDAPYGGPFEEVEVYDGKTGERLGPKTLGRIPTRFSADGRLLAFSTYEGISVWTDHELGVLKFDTYFETNSPIVFSGDSHTIATSLENEAFLWEIRDDELPDASTLTLSTESPISQILFSRDDTLFITVHGASGVIETWDRKTGERKTQFINPDPIYNVNLSADSELIHATGYGQQSLWNIYTGEMVALLPSGSVLNPDWSYAAYWNEGVVKIVDTESQQATELYVISGFLGAISDFSPLLSRVIFTDAISQMYALKSGLSITNSALNQKLRIVQFNDAYLITATNEQSNNYSSPLSMTIQNLLDTPLETDQLEIQYGGGNWLLSPDGKYIAQVYGGCGDGGGGKYVIWDVKRQLELISSGNGGQCGPYSYVFTPDGKGLIVGWDRAIDFVDLNLLDNVSTSTPYDNYDEVVTTSYLRYSNMVKNIAISNEGSQVALIFTPPLIEIHRYSELTKSKDPSHLPDADWSIPDAQHAIFSPDNQWIFTDVGVWNVSTGEKHSEIGSTVAAFSPDSTVLATARDQNVTLWDVSTLIEGNTAPLIQLNIKGVQELAFGADGTLLYIKKAGEMQLWGVGSVVP